MPAFQKLIQGGLSALGRAQEELNPAQKAEWLRAQLREAPVQAQAELLGHPAAASAQELYRDQLLSGLELYHGSPHMFSPVEANPLGEFDFLSHMGKGEGAQSFGPGGYLTGDFSLARHYAERLAERSGLPPPPPTLPGSVGGSPPHGWLAAYTHDPEGFLEFLRGRAMERANYYGLSDATGAKNFDAYLDAMRRIPRAFEGVHEPVTEKSSHRAADLGRRLLDVGALSEGPPSLSGPQLGERASVVRRNLNAVQEGFQPGSVPRRPTYKANATTSVYLPALGTTGERPVTPEQVERHLQALRDYPARLAAYEEKLMNDAAMPRPRIYKAETPVTPNELFSHDWPLNINAPRVVSALANVAEKHALPLPLDEKFGDVTGRDFLFALRNKLGQKGAVNAMREAGVPGMYFARAGRRDYFTLPPPTFQPENYNFVWFDDPLLNIKSRIDKARGGTVSS